MTTRDQLRRIVEFTRLIVRVAAGNFKRLFQRLLLAGQRPCEYSWLAAALQIPFVAFSICWLVSTPPQGYAVALLGVGSFVMAVRDKKSTRIEQVCWIAFALVLTLVEFSAIRKERDQNQEQQDAIQREQNGRLRALLKEGSRIYEKQDHLLTEIVGTGSYVMATVLMTRPGDMNSTMVFTISNPTAYPARNVSIRFSPIPPPPGSLETLSQKNTYMREVEKYSWSRFEQIGDVPAHGYSLAKTEVPYGDYFIDIQTMSQTYGEVLYIRKCNGMYQSFVMNLQALNGKRFMQAHTVPANCVR